MGRGMEEGMRSYAVTSFDSLDTGIWQEQTRPEPGPGDIRIRIEAAALGFVDGLMVQGRYQIKPPLPYVPGGEIAGIVDALGPGVASPAIGERVVTWQLGGGLADYTVVKAAEAEVVGQGLSPVSAAAMLVDYQTAHHALFDRGRLAAGDTLLVLGATGGVGAAALHMAVRAGARVIAAASTEDKRRQALADGAFAAIDYQRPDWRDALKAAAPGGVVDVVFDPVGGDSFEPAFRSLAKDGRHLVVGFAGGRIPALPINLALLKSAALVGVEIRHFLASEPARAARVRQALFSMVEKGLLPAPRIALHPLDRAAEALATALSRGKAGKVVIEAPAR